MSDDEFDVGEAAASPDKLEALNASLEEAIELEGAVAQMEEDLKATKKALHALRSSRIPDMMDEMGMDSLTFRGWKVSIQDFVSGGIPKEPEAHERAVRWLENEGAGGLIKTNLSIAFGKSQHNEALDLASRLQEEGHAPSVSSGVHPQTLHSFASERVKRLRGDAAAD